MKTISKDFWYKIARAGGILDTNKYRYVAIDRDTAKRALITNLGTTAMLEQDAWEILKVRCA